jgi:preprotein translocase SecE subunit
MAVAVKNPPVAPAASLLDRMPVVSLLGAAYVVVSLGIVLDGLPYLWQAATGLTGVGGSILLGLIMLAVATGLAILGVRLFGHNRPAGARAGVFFGLVGFVIALLLARWASLWVEYWVYVNHWLGDSPTVGLAITGVVGLVLLGVLGYLFFRPEAENFLVRVEGQGWFSATSYKGQQGQRVRRGTVLGILLIAGSGIWTMNNNGFLQRLPQSLYLNIPFTGAVVTEDMGDAGPLIKKLDPKDKDQLQIVSPGAGFQAGEVKTAQQYREALKKHIDTDGQVLDPATKARLEKELDDKDISEILNLPGSSDAAVAAIGQAALLTLPPPGLPVAELRLNQYALRNLNDQLRREYVRVENTGLSTELKRGEVIPKTQFDEAASKFSNPDDKPKSAVPFAATGPVTNDRLTLLPALQYTLPLLLIALALWGAWRVVNYPPFADFLIATEAELNKVSWTTRPRLIQDTIVVLVTTFLLAVFLFLMDQTWRVVLSWKPIGVLQISEDQGEKNKNVEQKPW